MGVSTKLFVTGNTNRFLDIMPKVTAAVSKYVMAELEAEMNKVGGYNNIHHFVSENKDNWSKGVYPIEVSSSWDVFSLYFKLHGENRRLAALPTCSRDYEYVYKGNKIIFDLSQWGLCHEIMMVVAEAVKEYGRVFYIDNDCSGEFKELFI
jgi:hypothetical protein